MTVSEGHSSFSPSRLKRLGFYLVFTRFAFLLFLTIIVYFLRPGHSENFDWLPMIPLSAIVVNFFLLLLNFFLGELKIFQILQLSTDVAFISILVFFTGGVDSNFVFLYYAQVIGSALILSNWTTIIFGSSATILIAVATIFQPAIGGQPEDLKSLFILLTAQASGIHLVAYLSAALSINLYKERIFNEEILENITDALFVINSSDRIAFLNPSAMRLLELTTKDINKRYYDVLDSQGLTNLMNVLEKDEEITIETEIEPSPGYIVPVGIKVSNIGKPHSTTAGRVIVVADLTGQKKLQEIETRSKRLSEYSLISAGVAHEIRNPLASIKAAAEEIKRDTTDPDQMTMVEILTKESDRLNSILSDFLQFTKIRLPNKSKTLVNRIFNDVRNTILAQSDCEVTYNCSSPGDLIIEVDQEQLKQVLLNLSLNSIQAAGDKVTINLSAKKQDLSTFILNSEIVARKPSSFIRTGVLITHSDNGPGIPAEIRDKIFLPFFTSKTKGTGLGLAMAQRIIDSHDGYVVANHDVKLGAEFKFWLPAYDFGEK